MYSCAFATCAPILRWFSGWLAAMLPRAPAASSCTPGLSAWRPIAVTRASIPPCVCVCVCDCRLRRFLLGGHICIHVHSLPARRSCAGSRHCRRPACVCVCVRACLRLPIVTFSSGRAHMYSCAFATCAPILCRFSSSRASSLRIRHPADAISAEWAKIARRASSTTPADASARYSRCICAHASPSWLRIF